MQSGALSTPRASWKPCWTGTREKCCRGSSEKMHRPKGALNRGCGTGASTGGAKPPPLKLAQLHAAKHILANAGVLRNFVCLMGVLLDFVAACFELCGSHSRDSISARQFSTRH